MLLIIISFFPLYKLIRKLLASPASYMVWLIIFITFFTLSKIGQEMTVISFFGFLGNLLGAVCFWLAKGRRAEK